MEGGIPRGFIVMVAGNPGTGKTILSSRFIYEGLTSSTANTENGLFISFSESKEQFYVNAKRLGMDFERFEKQEKFKFLDFVSITGEGIQDVFEEILASVKAINAKRVVLDSFSALSYAFENHAEARISIHVLLGKILRAEGVTSLLVLEVPFGNKKIGNGVEESVVDGIIKLEHGHDNSTPLFLRVLKMRGTLIDKERHSGSIVKDKGMLIYVKQTLGSVFPVSHERTGSGISGLDERMGNRDDGLGFYKGTLTAVVGATGSAKSTLAFQFIAEGIKKYGDSGIFCSLEDTEEEIRRMGNGFGYNVEELEKKVNGLSIFTSNPDKINPDAFIANLEEEIKRTKAKRLVIDGLSTFEYQYKKNMHVITKSISSLVRKYQVTTIVTILVSQKREFQVTDLNISALFQNILLVRFIEVSGHLKRVLLILKMTATEQDGSILEFRVSREKGIEIVGPIGDNYSGISYGKNKKRRETREIENQKGKEQ
jgi:circadian clock protein KaiC